MKYLIMIQLNPTVKRAWDEMPAEVQLEGLKVHQAATDAMHASGDLVITERLADPELAKRITVQDGKVLTTDGPFTEVKEYLAGFYLVDCENIDRAIEHAARLPEAAFGLVEVRPVIDLFP